MPFLASTERLVLHGDHPADVLLCNDAANRDTPTNDA